MAVLTTFPTLTCPHLATNTHPDHCLSTMASQAEQNKTNLTIKTMPVMDQPAEEAISPTSSEPSTPLPRRSSEAEIAARLARIPGHVNYCETLSCAVDPERIARLRKAQGEAMVELKGSIVFRPSSEMATALAEIERRKMWEDLKGE